MSAPGPNDKWDSEGEAISRCYYLPGSGFHTAKQPATVVLRSYLSVVITEMFAASLSADCQLTVSATFTPCAQAMTEIGFSSLQVFALYPARRTANFFAVFCSVDCFQLLTSNWQAVRKSITAR